MREFVQLPGSFGFPYSLTSSDSHWSDAGTTPKKEYMSFICEINFKVGTEQEAGERWGEGWREGSRCDTSCAIPHRECFYYEYNEYANKKGEKRKEILLSPRFIQFGKDTNSKPPPLVQDTQWAAGPAVRDSPSEPHMCGSSRALMGFRNTHSPHLC